jgi:hypothetical protein
MPAKGFFFMPHADLPRVETTETSKHQTSSKTHIRLRNLFVVFFFLIVLGLPSSTIAILNRNVPIQSYGTLSYPTRNVNLAVITDGWSLPTPPSTYTDYSVERTVGSPSFRIDADGTGNNAEINGKWLGCKPNDHIVFKVWIKTSAGTAKEVADQFSGGRLGIDFYAHTSAGYGGVESYPTDANHAAYMVRFGTNTWTLKQWDFLVPTSTYTFDRSHNSSCNPVQIDSFVIWLQLCVKVPDSALTSQGWFADAELYINPT